MELLASPFAFHFQTFVNRLETTCLICSPYITGGPIKKLIAAVESKGIQDTLAVTVLTNLSISNLMQGATDAEALLLLTERVARVTLVYLPRIHAKVYVANGSQAIVTSANFTDGGAFANLEYGVQTDDPGHVRAIEQTSAVTDSWEAGLKPHSSPAFTLKSNLCDRPYRKNKKLSAKNCER